jgi:hypothetical protein
LVGVGVLAARRAKNPMPGCPKMIDLRARVKINSSLLVCFYRIDARKQDTLLGAFCDFLGS